MKAERAHREGNDPEPEQNPEEPCDCINQELIHGSYMLADSYNAG